MNKNEAGDDEPAAVRTASVKFNIELRSWFPLGIERERFFVASLPRNKRGARDISVDLFKTAQNKS